MATRKKYTREFKQDAVRLVTEQGYNKTEAARNLGLDRVLAPGGVRLELGMTGRGYLFGLGVTLATGLLFGLAPALRWAMQP
mgnify:CR=1 FL=1